MSAFVTAGGGFLLAVLWMDLMFDVQAAKAGEGELPEAVLASTAAYYARVTTAARPMNRLIALVMAATLVALVREAILGTGPGWLPWVSLALALAPIAMAAARTVPSAARLGTRRDPPAVQSRLAREVLAQHVFCFVSIAGLVAVQLGWS